MRKRILGGMAVFALAALTVLNFDINIPSNSSPLLLANVEALAGFEFNGQDWDNDRHWYNGTGGNWSPSIKECTYTSSTGGSIGANINGYGGSISWAGTSTSRKGEMIVCGSGNGNCVNGTGCI